MNYDAPLNERIDALHRQAEDLAWMAGTTSDPVYAAELRTRADQKVRQAARLRAEGGE